MKFATLVFTALVSTLASNAQAAIVTVGSLTRDTDQATIADTLNNRTWLGWDVTKGLDYAQTVAATGIGGRFEGYSIAHNTDAQMFVNAMAGTPHSCTTTNAVLCITVLSGNAENVTGESFSNARLHGEAFDSDLVFFLSDNIAATPVGILEIATFDGPPAYAEIYKSNDVTGFDTPAAYVDDPDFSIGWMLYRDSSNSVPEPSGLALLGLAGAALGWSQRRRRLGASKSTQ